MKKYLSKLVAVMMAAMLLTAMLVSVNAAESNVSDSISEFAASDNAGVFGLRIAKDGDFYVITASLVRDGSNYYILTHEVAALYAADDYELTLMVPGGTNIPAYCVAVNDAYDIAYLVAGGMEFYNPLIFSDEPFTTTVVSGLVFCNKEYTEAKRVEYKASDLSGWTKINTRLYAKDNTELDNNRFGSPIFHDTKEYKIQGIGTWYENGSGKKIQAVMNFEGLQLNAAYALGAEIETETDTKSETKATTPAATEPEPEPQPEPGIDSKYLIIGAVVIAGIAYYIYNNKKKNEEPEEADEQASDSGYMPTQPVVPSHGVTKAVSNWQLRATEGPLKGKTFPLSGTVKIGRGSDCDIRFPDGTAGVSGSHCEVVVSGSSVILRDIGSSYGTFVSGSRLVPHTDKTLYPSDSFTLAQSGISFRLEATGIGEGSQTGGPSVKDVNGKAYQSKTSGKLTFGRNSGNSVQILSEDKQVSGNHCVLYREGGKLYLKDLGSTNGTFFSEQERLKPNTAYRVRKGQAFFLSSPKYTFVVTEE